MYTVPSDVLNGEVVSPETTSGVKVLTVAPLLGAL